MAKYSTSNVLGRDWSEVASELPERSKQQCKERYRLADTVAELTFVFLRVMFRGSPALRSEHFTTPHLLVSTEIFTCEKVFITTFYINRYLQLEAILHLCLSVRSSEKGL